MLCADSDSNPSPQLILPEPLSVFQLDQQNFMAGLAASL